MLHHKLLTDQELFELGMQIACDPTRDGAERQGRALNNIEMKAANAFKRAMKAIATLAQIGWYRRDTNFISFNLSHKQWKAWKKAYLSVVDCHEPEEVLTHIVTEWLENRGDPDGTTQCDHRETEEAETRVVVRPTWSGEEHLGC
jgi:hypothetical protein